MYKEKLAYAAVYGVLLLGQLNATEFWIYSGIPAVIHVRPALVSTSISTGSYRAGIRGGDKGGTDMDHSRNSTVYPEFHCISRIPWHLVVQGAKLRKRLHMPVSLYTSTEEFSFYLKVITYISVY